MRTIKWMLGCLLLLLGVAVGGIPLAIGIVLMAGGVLLGLIFVGPGCLLIASLEEEEKVDPRKRQWEDSSMWN